MHWEYPTMAELLERDLVEDTSFRFSFKSRIAMQFL